MSVGAVGALVFVVVVVLLLIVSIRSWGKRSQELAELMPTLGYRALDEPSDLDLVPALLFHPNGIRPADADTEPRHYDLVPDTPPRVPAAWRGHLGRHEVEVMDVSIALRRLGPTDRKSGQGSLADRRQFNWTVIRHAVGGKSSPPDFLIEERVLGKAKIEDARAINGPAEIGEHYYLFSSAADAELEPWITQRLREHLEHDRLWKIAVHGGVVFLACGDAPQKPAEMSAFLAAGEELLRAVLDV